MSHISLFPILRVVPRVPTVLHLSVAHEDDITRQLANHDGNYKFSIYLYSMLQEFTVDSEVIVTSHPEIVRRSHAWCTGSPGVLKRLTLMTDKLDISWHPSISSVFSRDDALLSTICVSNEITFYGRPSWRSAPPPWSRRDIAVMLPRPPPWPNGNAT